MKRKFQFVMPNEFWSKVDKTGDCWFWNAFRTKRGYGQIRIAGKIMVASHVAYLITHGEIPDGFFICHHCDNPPCVNPLHLFAGTQRDNMLDKVRKNRQPHGEKCYNSRLSDKDIFQIRLLSKLGFSGAKIGRKFGVSQPYVSRLLHQKRRTKLTINQ